jgi:molecular chaperone GrpE (heat shock protein)
MKISTKEIVFMSRVADQAERYADMIDFLIQAIESKDTEFNSDERNLLSVAFKNFINPERTAWRTIEAIEKSEKYIQHAPDCNRYKARILKELEAKCKKVIEVILANFLPRSNDIEARAFYLKLIGDYYRYIAENAKGDTLIEASD